MSYQCLINVLYRVVGGDWEVYKGVISVEELLLLSKYETVDNEKTSNIVSIYNYHHVFVCTCM